MIAVNLIPQSRLEGHRRRVRLRRWLTVAGAYALFLVVAMVASTVTGSRDDQALRRDLERSAASVEAAGLRLRSLEHDLVEATSLLTANRSVGNQPDWSVLLGLISNAVEDKIVLRKCTVQPAPPGRSAAAERGLDETLPTVELHGLARTQVDVSDFVLRMESVPVFRGVTRHDTRRVPFRNGHVVAFRLDFGLDGSGGER